MLKVAIGADHAGFQAKKALAEFLRREGFEVQDVGAQNEESSDDYPDFASRVAQLVSGGRCDRGILVCGTGIGMGMAANKFPGVRAAVCHNEYTAQAARSHNNANVLCMGGRVLTPQRMLKLTRIFLQTEAEGGRHKRRVDKIERMEREQMCKPPGRTQRERGQPG